MTLILGDMALTINGWTLAFLLSLATIGFLMIYVRYLLRELVDLSETIVEMNNEFISFSSHLKALHEMEMFYGDETLGGLMDHSKHLINLFENFEDQVGFEDDAEENEEDLDDGTEEAQTPQIQQQAEVFYGGTRGGNP